MLQKHLALLAFIFLFVFFQMGNKLGKFSRVLRLSWGRWGKVERLVTITKSNVIQSSNGYSFICEYLFPDLSEKSHAYEKKYLIWAPDASSALSFCSFSLFLDLFHCICGRERATSPSRVDNRPERCQLVLPLCALTPYALKSMVCKHNR